jgi:hypothetical protein
MCLGQKVARWAVCASFLFQQTGVLADQTQREEKKEREKKNKKKNKNTRSTNQVRKRAIGVCNKQLFYYPYW